MYLDIIFCRIVNVDSVDEDGNTSLCYAAENGHLEVAKELMKMRANIKAKDGVGDTPVHKAAEGGHTK